MAEKPLIDVHEGENGTSYVWISGVPKLLLHVASCVVEDLALCDLSVKRARVGDNLVDLLDLRTNVVNNGFIDRNVVRQRSGSRLSSQPDPLSALRAMVDAFADPLAEPPRSLPLVYKPPMDPAQAAEEKARRLRQQSVAWRNAKELLG